MEKLIKVNLQGQCIPVRVFYEQFYVPRRVPAGTIDDDGPEYRIIGYEVIHETEHVARISRDVLADEVKYQLDKALS